MNQGNSNVSPLGYLWKAVRSGNGEVSDDFIDEFEHLFKAIKGYSHIYPSHLVGGTVIPDFQKYFGRDAAVKRSDFLDNLGQGVARYLLRYPDGLHPDVEKKRLENKKRILIYARFFYP